MTNLITIEEALAIDNRQFIDLRSPEEYLEAHIPEAINYPLLEDEERAIVGIIYKEQSPERAVEKGFGLIAPKLPDLCNKIKSISTEKTVVLYCWRGGMRSESISKVLDILNVKHYRLEGGYKSFRSLVLKFFEKKLDKDMIVLDGLTGVGKTEILEALIKEGLPAIDLEGLANNRGSVFGNVGLPKQPMQKHFEGMLFCEYVKFKQYPTLIVECESRRIGSNIIPEIFFTAMEQGRHILIYDSLPNRVARLTATYTGNAAANNEEQLSKAIYSLKKRLGNKKTDILLECLAGQDYKTLTEILLTDYYDPLYNYPDLPTEEYELSLNAADFDKSVSVLKSILV